MPLRREDRGREREREEEGKNEGQTEPDGGTLDELRDDGRKDEEENLGPEG